jgi:DNA-binding transcriptional LysR family regulator
MHYNTYNCILNMRICMDWRSIKFDWNRARAFLVTAEEGSLSAAARSLGMTQPTLGRQVSALEAELGVALFEREGRGLKLTPSGLALIEHVRIMGDAANNLSLTASGQSQSIEGKICITASEDDAVFILPPIIAKLRNVYPGIKIEVVASNKTIDLRRREADIAIRGYRPTQHDLIARKINKVFGYLYATKEYINNIGNPTSFEDLNNAEFIGFNSTFEMINYLKKLGLNLTQKNFYLLAENRIVQWELVKLGLGIGILPDYMGESNSNISKVLPLQKPLEGELWLVTHRELKMNQRIRVVYDFLALELS